MAVQAVKPYVKGGDTVTTTPPLEVNVHRREMRLTGDAHDFNRLIEAGKQALADYEQKRRDPAELTTVIIHEPSPDDP